MSALEVEHCQGQQLKITGTEIEDGAWQSSVEVDLGRTGCVVFENTDRTYSSQEEAREAVLALAVENLSRSRIAATTQTVKACAHP